jgi:hypothetical protein
MGLVSHTGDGIDVSFQLGVQPPTFDVALRHADGRLVVAECKRYRNQRIKPGWVKQFAYDVERLRASQVTEVAAFFFTSSDYQLGALKTAFEPGIRMVLFAPDQAAHGLVYSYLRYDPERARNIRDAFVLLTGAARGQGSASATLTVRAAPRTEGESP